MGFFANNWGDLLGLIGLVITLLQVRSARSAAEHARKAAEQVRDQISTLDTLSEISAAISLLDELKNLQRLGAWDLLLDRLGGLRRRLVRIEHLVPAANPMRAKLANPLIKFRIIEEE